MARTIPTPPDHNWTHLRFCRTMQEAFPMDFHYDLYVPPEYDSEDLVVMYACTAAALFLSVYLWLTR